MGKIQEVKERADIVKVAEYFGIQLNRNYKAKCPFHQEKTASLSIHKKKQIFKCFGCGKGGDVITLVQELLNINAYEAAKHINQICGCGVNFEAPIDKYDVDKFRQKQEAKEKFNKWKNEIDCFLLDYYRELRNIIKYSNVNELELYIKEFCIVENLIYKLENYPLLLWKCERKRVEEVVRKYKR